MWLGFWHATKDTTAELRIAVERMASALEHRGPDDSGSWVDPAAGIALGFRRLAILDLSPTGHQPMVSRDGRFVTVFNGEIYNHRDLRATLEESAVRFRGTSDTEVILEACSAWGVKAAVPRLWGMFAIAIWDRRDRVLTLARDRIGKKPLYYGYSGDTFLFGSELKAIRAFPGFAGEIDRDALLLYLRFGYVPAPHSIYRGIAKLPQGTIATVRQGEAPRIEPYWQARQVVEEGLANRLDLSAAEAKEELDGLLRDAVRRRMIADVPLGALLSGGVDSSVVVALMQAQSARPVQTFTIGFFESAYNEAEAAKAVANHLGTDHTELYVTPEQAQAVIPRLPDLYDEPFADSSQIPTFLVCELARRHVTVSLSGDGGDELFAGYTRYLWAEDVWRRLRHVPMVGRSALASVLGRVPPQAWDRLYSLAEPLVPARARMRLPGDKLHKLAQWLTVGGPSELYQRVVSQWPHPEGLAVGGAGAGDRALRWRARPDHSRLYGTDDVPGPGHLPARRHPGEGGSRQHGGEPRGPQPAPRPPRRRMGVAAAPRVEEARRLEQVAFAAGPRPIRSGRAHRSAEDGVWRADRLVAAGAVAGMGRGASRRGAPAPRGIPASGADP